MRNKKLTIALPKGRLSDLLRKYLTEHGLNIDFAERRLTSDDEQNGIRFYLVKNSDLPTYVTHGIAGMGICGEDVIYESGFEFHQLFRFPFGQTSLSLATPVDQDDPAGHDGSLTVATSYPAMTRDYFHSKGLPVNIIRLNGSVELAPALGLCSCISDLVETGATLKANGLRVVRELRRISVYLIANPAYYKLNHERIDHMLKMFQV